MMISGWEEKTITSIANVSTGKWDANHSTPNGEYKFFTCAAEPMLCDTCRYDGECLILPGNGANVGCVYYFDGKFDAYQRTYVISDIKELSVKYLYYFLLCYWRDRNSDKQYGAATNYIKIGNFQNFIVSFPKDNDEQQRIVEKLDTLFADIEKEKQVIQQKLQNAKELFESELHKLFTESADGWIETKLDDVCVFERGLTYSKQDERDFSNNVVLRANNINLVSHALNFDELKFIDDAINIPMEKKIATNTILMCISSGSKSHLGKVAFVDRDYGYAFGGFMGLIKPMSNILAKYLYYVLVGPDFKDLIAHLTDGANINNLKYSNIQQFSFLLPTMEEQQRIVEKLNALREQTQELEQIYTQQIADLDELKQAILKKAFNGEL